MKTKIFSFTGYIYPILFLLICSLTTQRLYSQVSEYIITNTLDSGAGSLSQALADAFEHNDTVIITFQIPKTDPGFNADTGVWTIKPTSRFSTMYSRHVVINGMSQSEFIGEDTNPFGPEIVISGESISVLSDGISLVWSSLEMMHICINRFSAAGVVLWGSPQAVIAGCYFGTGPAGNKEAGNAAGIVTYDKCRNIHIVPLDTIPNIFGGNGNGAIFFEDTCTHSLITGNIIGLNRDRSTVLGSQQSVGICFKTMCDSNTVIDNWIGGNQTGIWILNSNENLIAGNKIGTDTAWTTKFTNSLSGIRIDEDSKRNKIMGNHIGNSSKEGIRIKGSKALYNTISENSISLNDSKGISLVDSANGGIAAPKISHVLGNEIFGTALPGSIIEIFTDNDDEGRIIQAVVVSDSIGNWGWEGPIQGPFDSIRATATDTMGNTSEFGKYVKGEDPTSIESLDPVSFTLSNNYPNPNHPEMQIMINLPASTEVNLDVYNLSGVKVYEIHKGKLQAGFHSVTWNTSQHAAGIYLIRMQTYRGALTRKCVVLK